MSTRSTSRPGPVEVAPPAGAAGDRARWMLATLARASAGGPDCLDLAEIDEQFGGRPDGVDDAFVRKIWSTAARRLGGGRLVEVLAPREHQLDLLIEVTADRRFWLLVEVAPDPPHVLTRWGTAPALPAGVELRRAEPEDGPGLAALERDAPIVVGEVATRFEYEGDYFEWWQLLDDPGAVIAVDEVDGIVAAVQTSTVPLAVDGKIYRASSTHRVRTHPAHAGRGLLQQLTRAGLEAKPLGVAMDALVVSIAKGNDAMQKDWAGRPGQWPHGPTRFLIDVAASASANAMADLTWDPPSVETVRIVNAGHATDEGFLPYTEETFAARLRRAPDLYGPKDVARSGGAVLGTWELGRRLRTVVTTATGEDVQRRAIAADWGVEPGHDDDLERLIRGVCAVLTERGCTHLAVFSSPPTPGWDVLSALSCGRDEFDLWTPPVAPVASADRGTYVDAIAF